MASKPKTNKTHERRPPWLKISLQTNEDYRRVDKLLSKLSLHTVCQEARCPNMYECWCQGTATFMILGEVCTRHCGFCSVTNGRPAAIDPSEPENVAEAVQALSLDYAVITSVTRDDLADEGAEHFAQVIRAIKQKSPQCKVEVLIPDFNGTLDLLEIVLEARPEVLGHNMETVKDLYHKVRPQAVYDRSLAVLEHSVRYRNEHCAAVSVKSGIMVGLGETFDQVLATFRDIAGTGCDIMTVGQYLSPVKKSLAVQRFYTPAEFIRLRDEGARCGFKHVESGPLVRSSYHAKSQEQKLSLGHHTS
ncbi:MAG: lipoyl synthase [Candidatus Latescibacterota bacterium]